MVGFYDFGAAGQRLAGRTAGDFRRLRGPTPTINPLTKQWQKA